jgi:hypothetical protein
MDLTKLTVKTRKTVLDFITKAAKDLEKKKIAILLEDTGWIEHHETHNRKCLYYLSVPLMGYDESEYYNYVRCSASHNQAVNLYETYIFPSNEELQWVNYSELPGSTREHIDPERVIEDLGYTIVRL